MVDGRPACGLSAANGYRRHELVERAPHAASTLIEHVGVDHRRAHVAMPQELLDRPDVVSRFEQVRRERVAQRVTSRRSSNASGPGRFLYGALGDRLMEVMSATFSGCPVDIEARGGKRPTARPIRAARLDISRAARPEAPRLRGRPPGRFGAAL